VTLPFWLATAAMVGLGTVSGGRFTGTPIRLLLGYLSAALGAFAVSLAVTAAFGILATLVTPLPMSDLIVAYAPGAVDAMMILALALHLDPVFVGAHHLSRVFVVSLGLPFLAHYFSPPGSRRTRSVRPMVRKSDGLDD